MKKTVFFIKCEIGLFALNSSRSEIVDVWNEFVSILSVRQTEKINYVLRTFKLV